VFLVGAFSLLNRIRIRRKPGHSLFGRRLQDGKHFLLRSEAQGACGTLFAAAGVALPPTVQQIEAP
jgi:hypothetical protein